MGKKLDALLGRSFRPSKLRPLVNLALSRLAILKTPRQSRCSLARSDVVHLLGVGQQERALLRVEQVIKEQNALDVLDMIESYCNVVIERMDLIQEERECPEELKEAISSLIFASSRTGEFPELQEMRAVFASRFGKEFVARSVELRNNCGVNVKMIQKLSTRQPSLETRIKALQEIATENGMDLNLENATGEKSDKQKSKIGQQSSVDIDEGLNDSAGDLRRKYKDVADAAQEAFKSAANAAEAAKAAVELSRYRPPDTDNHDSRDLQRKEDSRNKEINPLSLKTRELDVQSAKTNSHREEALEDDVINSTTQAEEDPPHLPDDEEKPVANSDKESWKEKVQVSDARKGRVSVRTRR